MAQKTQTRKNRAVNCNARKFNIQQIQHKIQHSTNSAFEFRDTTDDVAGTFSSKIQFSFVDRTKGRLRNASVSINEVGTDVIPEHDVVRRHNASNDDVYDVTGTAGSSSTVYDVRVRSAEISVNVFDG